MPRDSGGTYTLPAGNPVVSGTTITSDWGNNTMSDVAAVLTDSLSRTGNGGMQAALKNINGTEANPSIVFNNDLQSGMFLNAVDDIMFSLGGSKVLRLNAGTAYLWDTVTSQWLEIQSGAGAASGIEIFAQTISADYTLPSGNNALSVNPTIASGVTVTIPSGSEWHIVGA